MTDQERTQSAAEKYWQRIRDEHWPGWQEEMWVGNKNRPGWTLIPRTIDLIGTLIGRLKPKKSPDAGRAYLNLWCRGFAGVVEVKDEREVMYACGYGTSRGRRTWRESLKVLEALGFIRVCKPWGDDSIAFIFLPDPDMIIQRLDAAGNLPEDWKPVYERRLRDLKVVRWEPKAVEKADEAEPKRKRAGRKKFVFSRS